MALFRNETLTSSGTLIVPLTNHRGERNIYSVAFYGDDGGGTTTAFLNFAGRASAIAGTTNDIAILDGGNTGSAISKTAPYFFNFEINSDPQNEVVLKVILAGATTPSWTIKVFNVA